MTNAITKTNGQLSQVHNVQQLDLIKTQICKGASNTELDMFMAVCSRTGLDPFQRQIFAVRRYDSREKREVMSIQVSIDGFRLIAERTGRYEGQTQPMWCGTDGQWTDVWLSSEPPAAAKVGVYKAGFREPLIRVALWSEFHQTYYDKKTQAHKLSPMWQKMGALMLAKCSESQALRAAFPQEMSGLYTREEMSQSQTPVASTPARGVSPNPITSPDEVEWDKYQNSEGQVIPPNKKSGFTEQDKFVMGWIHGMDRLKPTGTSESYRNAYALASTQAAPTSEAVAAEIVEA